METTVGKRIANYRKEKGLTQEDVATALGISAQAVSKWENDLTCPDIMLLIPLAQFFHVSVDTLLGNDSTARYIPEDERKAFEELTLRILIETETGDSVRVNLPLPLLQVAIDVGMKLPQVSGNKQLESLDFSQILLLVESGFLGNLVEIDSAEGDTIRILVE
ncbi:MAG: helix-turn-helix domain-containing protein [Culicoidibacterales bacterium]